MYSIPSTTGAASGATNIPARLEPDDIQKSSPRETTDMAAELTAIGHSAAPSMASLQIGQDSIVTAAAYLRSAPVSTGTYNVDGATEAMKEEVRKGVRDKQDVVAPQWFKELSEHAKREVAQRVVDWVFAPVNSETERWFNRFTADNYIRQYLNGTVSRATYYQVSRLSCLRHVKERIENYGMLEGGGDGTHPLPDRLSRAERIETAKADMWDAVRKAFRELRGVTVPASFLALNENDRRDVVRLTVSWVFSPVNRETHRWFVCLIAEECLRPYLKHTVPQDTYDEVVRVGLGFVRVKIEEYRMLVEEGWSHPRISLAASDLWRAVLDGVANGYDAKTPGSFVCLSKEEMHDVVRLVVAKLLPVTWMSFENHFNRLTANEDVKPFLKGTLSQSDVDGISDKLKMAGSDAMSHVMSRIETLRMVASRYEDPVQKATCDLWEAVLNGLSDAHYATTPASFKRLSSSEDMQAAVNGAVSNLNDLQVWEIESHFNCLTSNADVKPFLKGSMTKTHFDAIERKLRFFTSPSVWRAVTGKMKTYQMDG
ncbi:hypothetical protein UC34_00285 [Pandoraea vervacti]|uniref:Uncharacterized protein n=1 Tax=Pandoraea vervacti TaxID=656178 RepID=A0ABM5STU8_9BURK|nr:hypothetical protein [Pandoraea vervacti]AJP55849.1 hypothetical protein UC34_00285 [Pandoraea vervacti]